MPSQSGIDLAARIAERRPDIGIILLSGYMPEVLDLEPALARGARFIAKPVTSGELRGAIREVMAAKRQPPGP
jgi:FixJ family two-component response regulator